MDTHSTSILNARRKLTVASIDRCGACLGNDDRSWNFTPDQSEEEKKRFVRAVDGSEARVELKRARCKTYISYAHRISSRTLPTKYVIVSGYAQKLINRFIQRKNKLTKKKEERQRPPDAERPRDRVNELSQENDIIAKAIRILDGNFCTLHVINFNNVIFLCAANFLFKQK